MALRVPNPPIKRPRTAATLRALCLCLCLVCLVCLYTTYARTRTCTSPPLTRALIGLACPAAPCDYPHPTPRTMHRPPKRYPTIPTHTCFVSTRAPSPCVLAYRIPHTAYRIPTQPLPRTHTTPTRYSDGPACRLSFITSAIHPPPPRPAQHDRCMRCAKRPLPASR